jgi:hypothetical protein
MFMTNNNFSEAKANAQANANSFGIPYVIFKDTSGNTRVERLSSVNPPDPYTIVYPQKEASGD